MEARVLVYRGGDTASRMAAELVVGFGFPTEQITVVSEYEEALRALYGANCSKEKLLSLPGPLVSPSPFRFVLAGAGRNTCFLTNHVVRVCGLPFGVLSKALGRFGASYIESASFAMSEMELRRPEVVTAAQAKFWEAMEKGSPYQVPSWSKRKSSIRHDPDWVL